MATEQIHLALLWRADRKGKLRAEQPLKFKAPDQAKARVERAADRFAGGVAITQSIDTDTGEVDEKVVEHFRFGRLPREFEQD